MGNALTILLCVCLLSWAWRMMVRTAPNRGKKQPRWTIHSLDVRADFDRILNGVKQGDVLYLADLNKYSHNIFHPPVGIALESTPTPAEMREYIDRIQRDMIRSMALPSHIVTGPPNIIHTTV